jgi:hypothetical protein
MRNIRMLARHKNSDQILGVYCVYCFEGTAQDCEIDFSVTTFCAERQGKDQADCLY